ncbi:type I glyceraldehyde-3-phosphate dehydrogenase [Patescibacteria group bacterium]|nr:type I glyceraldehyde-3-phosphate dehydrogenase [Patescibacteria group bacterium]
MSKPRVAINGFGRIGRDTFRANLLKNSIDIVAINDLGGIDTTIHLLKYDSVYGRLNNKIEKISDTKFSVDGKEVICVSDRDPENLPWKDLEIDIVLECTGVFRDKEGAGKHLAAGAKKVIISAPGKDEMRTIVMGVNENTYKPEDEHIISNASCTTNCLAPAAKVLNDQYGIKKGLMTTIHSYTNDQKILDLPHKDLRRARAAALSMIPTSTGAAKAIGLVIPELAGKLNGLSIRIPTPTVSLVDLVIEVEKETTVEKVNEALKEASEGELKGYLDFSNEPLVSIDYVGNNYSSIIDGLSTMVLDGNMIKILAWYDNEWGYSCRLVDLAAYVGGKL